MGNVFSIVRVINSSMCIRSIIVIVGLVDNKIMNKNKWRKKDEENLKVEGIRRKYFLK